MKMIKCKSYLYLLFVLLLILIIILRFLFICWYREGHHLYFIDGTLHFQLFNEHQKNPLHVSDISGAEAGSDIYPIARIIHQTWKDANVPKNWREPYQSCQQFNHITKSTQMTNRERLDREQIIQLTMDDVNADSSVLKSSEGFIYILWTDEMIQKFLKLHYPWFMSTYESYPYNIQRVDAARYFILFHFGGIYIDLDIGCRRSLKSLTTVPYVGMIVPLTNPVGYSNDFIVARRGHPLLLQMMQQLPNWNHYFLIQYLTIFFGTGPAFLSYQIGTYTRKHSDIPHLSTGYPYLLKDWISTFEHEYYGGQHHHAFFRHYTGNSWHGNDAKVILWFYNYPHISLFCILYATLSMYILYNFISNLRKMRQSKANQKAFRMV